MSATPEFPRASRAANSVDPMMLATALDHIARTASKSRSMTRRIRWITMRAEYALAGKEYRDTDVDLPKSPGPDTAEKLQKRLAFELSIKHDLVAALEGLMTVEGRGRIMPIGAEWDAARAAIARATGTEVAV